MIKKILIITLVCCMMTFLMIAGGHEETFACCSRGVSPSGHFGSSPHNGVTLPPPMVPPGFPYRWETSDVVDSFKEKKLAVTEVSTVTIADKFAHTDVYHILQECCSDLELASGLLLSHRHYAYSLFKGKCSLPVGDGYLNLSNWQPIHRSVIIRSLL